MRLRYLLVVFGLVAAAACGGGSSATGGSSSTSTPSPTPQAVSITETEFALSPATLNLKAGDYVFQVQNSGKAPHDVHILDSSNQEVAATSAVLQAGSSSTFNATLKAGTYTMYCAVDAHRTRGMQGTITVT